MKSWTDGLGRSVPSRRTRTGEPGGAVFAQRRALRGVGARPDPRRTRSLPRQRPPPPRGVAGLLERAACSALISEDEELCRLLASSRACSPARRGPQQRSRPADIPRSVPLPSSSPRSTGAPKAALHTFGNHHHSALGSNANIALRAGDRWLHSLPLYHVGGLSILFRCLLAGATVALPQPGTTLGESIAGLAATHVSLVSTQLLGCCERAPTWVGWRPSSWGGPVPSSLVDEALARGLPLHTSYGLTEMASQVTTTPPGARPEQLRTAGRALPGREVSISERGEILVRGDSSRATPGARS